VRKYVPTFQNLLTVQFSLALLAFYIALRRFRKKNLRKEGWGICMRQFEIRRNSRDIVLFTAQTVEHVEIFWTVPSSLYRKAQC